MDEVIRQLMTIARGMWHRRWIGVLVAWLVAVAGAVFLLRTPDRYEAAARVYVDTQSVLKPLMSGLTVQPDVNQQISMLARTLITRPNIEKLIRAADLEITVKNERERDALIDHLTKEIKLSGGRDRENVYNVTYRDQDQQRAQKVVQGLVSLFVESGIGNKRRDNEAARKFIDEQIESYEAKLEEAEARLKDFKLKNLSFTTASNQDYFGRMATLNEELVRVRTELHAAEQSRDALKRELAGEEPVLLPEPQVAAAPSALPEIDSRIDSQRKQLDELLRRFTEEHPDVVATQRLIRQLEEQKKQELEARRTAAAAQNKGRISAATNPVFQRLKISLAESEANVASLRGRASELQGRLEQLRGSAGRVPQVEAELAQLNRDYEVLRKNYEQLVSRRESAAMSEDVDATARLAEFRVIEPPRVAPAPVFPNRLMLIPLVLIASIGAGAFACFLFSQLFPTVHDTRMLRSLTQRPVLGSVSMRVSASMVRQSRVATGAFAASIGSLVFIYGAWAAWLVLQARA